VSAPHLLPAGAALLVAAVVLAGWYQAARRAEARSAYALASPDIEHLPCYRAPQVEAFRRRDLLPVYGSSEVLVGDAYRADKLFQTHPAGFLPFPVGLRAGTALIHLQKLASIGPALRGKKVVISITPSAFVPETAPPEPYAGNFSPLDANELAFSTRLSFAVKQAAARRMVQYPRTLDRDLLLRFALEKLADGTPGSAALYYAALPLGKLQCALFRMQDHWETRSLIRERAAAGPAPPGPPEPVDWDALADQAEREYRTHADNNPFGIENRSWAQSFASQVAPAHGPRDSHFLRRLDRAAEWKDLDLLLRALRELGAQPLLVSTPLKGELYDYAGISAGARQVYYRRLRGLARAHGIPLVDFAGHDQDRYFLLDFSHLSSKGWVCYARALDTFYHLPPGGDMAPAPLPPAEPPQEDSPDTTDGPALPGGDWTDLLTIGP
jgi:D-alanine transfer protein